MGFMTSQDHELRDGAATDPLHWTISEPGGRQDNMMESTVGTKVNAGMRRYCKEPL